jgi:hypothetical protein
MFKKVLMGSLAAVLAVAGLAAQAEDTTITGEPVDISCFLGGKSGEAHIACAKSCAEKGQPLGIAAKGADGKEVLYLALGAAGIAAKDILAPSMGKQVKVTGAVSEKGGMKVVTISKVEAAAAGGVAAWKPATTGSASIQNSAPKAPK